MNTRNHCRVDCNLPVKALQVVVTVEELHFLERGRTGSVADNRRMQFEERVQRRCSRLLRSDDDQLRKSTAALLLRPNVQVTTVVARVLNVNKAQRE